MSKRPVGSRHFAISGRVVVGDEKCTRIVCIDKPNDVSRVSKALIYSSTKNYIQPKDVFSGAKSHSPEFFLVSTHQGLNQFDCLPGSRHYWTLRARNRVEGHRFRPYDLERTI